MEVYLLKSSACLLLFFLFYKLFLERENMHYIKRLYLVFSVILSLIIPLITLTQYVDISKPLTNDLFVLPLETQEESLLQTINYQAYFLWGVYFLGVLIFGIRFFFNLNNIHKKINSNTKERYYSFIHVLLKETTIPHTFFNYIFLNKNLYKDNKIPKEVLLHEQAHASQKHSIDILFIEVLKVVFWFNPLFYLYKKEIKLNHEFLADQAVLQKGLDAYTYKELLLSFSSNQSNPSLANAINYSSIKKRFTVMKKQTSKQAIWLKGLIIIPLIGFILYGFSDKKVVEREVQSNTVQTSSPEPIDLYVNNNNKILLVDDVLPLDDLIPRLESYSSGINKGKDIPGVTIHVAPKVPMGFITNIKDALNTSGWEDIKVSLWNYPLTEKELPQEGASVKSKPHQEGASAKQIAEYNKLAKRYNQMIAEGGQMTFRLKEVERLKYIYNLMTDKQRAKAEAFPNLPPPPPSPAEIEVEDPPAPEQVARDKQAAEEYRKAKALYKEKKELAALPPPPPPVPADATPKQKERYRKTIEEYKQAKVLYEKKSKLATLPPPPPPPSPLDHIIKMAKEDASFYLEGQPISSDKAIEVIKNNKSLNINSMRSTGGKPKVYITKDPIEIKN